MKITKKIILGAAIAALSLSVAVGCTNLGTNQEQEDKDPVTVVDPNPSQEKVKAKVFFADEDAMYLVPEEVVLEKDNRSQAELLVESLIKGPANPKYGQVLPEGTKLLSLEVVDGVAYVNFSHEAKSNHWGGTTGESMTINSVVNTLSQLPEVDKVQFLIEGEKEESIWGHGYTMEPFEYNEQIINPDYR